MSAPPQQVPGDDRGERREGWLDRIWSDPVRQRFVWLLALSLCILFAARIAVVFAADGNVNQDEGWYLQAANLLYHGRIPYRDFAFFQAPLLPLIYGLPQVVFGPGLWVGRLTSLALTALMAALAFRIALARAGRVAALAALLLLVLSPYAVWALTSTRTEPLTALLWMAAAAFLLHPTATPRASGGAMLCAVLAAAVRVSSLPAAAFVLLWVVVRHRASRRELFAALAPAAGVALLVGGLLGAAGPSQVFFDLFTAQTQRHSQLRPAEAWGLAEFAQTRLVALSAVPSIYGGVAMIALPAGLVAGVLWLARRPGSATRRGAAAGLAALAAAVYLPNLAPRFVHAVYFAAAFPLCAVLVACLLGWALERTRGVSRAALALAAGVLLAVQLASFARGLRSHVSLAAPELGEVREVGRQLASLVPEDRKLLTLDTYLAVESRRPVVPGFEMGMFAWSPNWPEEWAGRYHLATPARWQEALRDPSVGAVVLSDFAIGVIVNHRFRGYRPRQELSEAQLFAILPGLERFRLDRVVPKFGQTRDFLYILLPRIPLPAGRTFIPLDPDPDAGVN